MHNAQQQLKSLTVTLIGTQRSLANRCFLLLGHQVDTEITCIYIPYLFVLKPGSYTCRGSNIRRVVQQNEGNKCLGPFKCRVSKLFNLINVKMVQYIKENKLIIDISLDMCILLSDIATVNHS